MHAACRIATVILVFALAAATTPVSASPITIGEFDFDLTQFDHAYVTVGEGVTKEDVHSSHFDNNFQIDPEDGDETDRGEPNGYELGELAGREGGEWADSDYGDRITLDGTGGPKSLTLNYGKNIYLNDYSDFVVHEQGSSSDATTDDEGKNFRIKFAFGDGSGRDSTDWFRANPKNMTGILDDQHPGSSQNQIFFSLPEIELESDKPVRSVKIGNLADLEGIDDKHNDPDFLFAGFATQTATSTSVALPSSMFLLLSGLVFGGLFYAWRYGFGATPAPLRAVR